MATPAIEAVLAAVIARVEAITPTIDVTQLFARKGVEKVPASTRARKRFFDVDFGSMRDLSNDGQGVQNPGLADQIATITLKIDYAAARNEKAIETTMAVDAALILRALGRSANWAGTPIRRVEASAEVERGEVLPLLGMGTAILQLIVAAEIQYRDVE